MWLILSPKNIGILKTVLFYGIIFIPNVIYYIYTYVSDKIGQLLIYFRYISVLSHVNQHTKTPHKCKHNPTIRKILAWYGQVACYRSMDTTGDPVPVGQRDLPVNHFTG